jgi:Peptidase family S41/N-terminal domain of Peptidase_S41 in eukaryotic IRBP
MPPRIALSIIAQASALSFAVSCSSPQRTSNSSSVASAKPGPAHGRFAGAVTALSNKLEASYVIRDIGARYAARLRTNLAQGAYDAIVDRDEIARQLAHDLQAVVPDGHLRVVTDASLTPDGHLRAPGGPGVVRGPGGPGGPARPPAIGDMAWLADGVAYIQFNEFPGDPETVATVDRFMIDHASAKAIIIDARSHHGGGTAEMNVMLPYLYAKETPLVDMDVAERVDGDHGPPVGGPSPSVVLGAPGQLRGRGISTQDGRSLHVISGPPGLVRHEHVAIPHPTEHRLFAAKVFYLTSSRTFSAAEHLAFAFKLTGRAVLIGERTGGGNHFGGWESLGDGLSAFIPIGRTLDPVTGADWEGVGVAPDVAVPAVQALDEAVRRATQH